MARRFTRSRGRSGAPRRESLWIGITETRNSIAAASTAVIINSSSAGALALRPFTIIRTRGYLTVRSDQEVADETFGIALGFAVVSDQALAIGVTAVPTPSTDLGSDLFFVYETILGEFIEGATNTSMQDQPYVRYDSKAMRRVNEDQDIAFVVETPSTSSSGLVQHVGRMLVKLH